MKVFIQSEIHEALLPQSLDDATPGDRKLLSLIQHIIWLKVLQSDHFTWNQFSCKKCNVQQQYGIPFGGNRLEGYGNVSIGPLAAQQIWPHPAAQG